MANETIGQVIWSQYEETFPDRYLERSYFDDFKDRMVTEGLDILDIGGGVKGCLSPAQAKRNNAWLLDPFLYKIDAPEGYIAKISDIKGTKPYDLIIMRGSFNYIPPLSLLELKDYLKPGGNIIFNTFIEPTEIFRPYFKKKKFTGYEKTIFVPGPGSSVENGTMWHFLIPEKGKIIQHSFSYYSHNWIKPLFKDMAIQRKTDKNTAIYVIQHSLNEIRI